MCKTEVHRHFAFLCILVYELLAELRLSPHHNTSFWLQIKLKFMRVECEVVTRHNYLITKLDLFMNLLHSHFSFLLVKQKVS